MIRNPSQKPVLAPVHALPPATAADPTVESRLGEARRLLHGAAIDPRARAAVEELLTDLARDKAERDAENARLRLENGRLEGILSSARRAVAGATY